MPCNCYGYDPTEKEKQASMAACLLDELNGKEWTKREWKGYHTKRHNSPDKLIIELCSRLRQIDVTKYSLEMQIWWRDHQEYDRKRIAKEKEELEGQKQRHAALSKLTAEERKLLGF